MLAETLIDFRLASSLEGVMNHLHRKNLSYLIIKTQILILNRERGLRCFSLLIDQKK